LQEIHYKYFKELYDEENRRAAELHDNAKVNTTIVSLYAAFVALASTKSPLELSYRISRVNTTLGSTTGRLAGYGSQGLFFCSAGPRIFATMSAC
jgi:hypothetical protein